MKLTIFRAILLITANSIVSFGYIIECRHIDRNICSVSELKESQNKDENNDRTEFIYGPNESAHTITGFMMYDNPYSYSPATLRLDLTEIFQILPNLESLFLDTGKFNLSAIDWHHAINLKDVRLHSSAIFELPAQTFRGMDNLEKLTINSSPLFTIKRNSLTGMYNLMELDLHDNQIQTIEDGSIQLPKLIRLNLRSNQLSTLPEAIFCQIPNLQEIDLGKNRLTQVGQSFYCLPTSDLINNLIDSIDNATASENTSLKRISIDGNKLTNHLDLLPLSVFKGLTDLNLDDNPYTDFDFGTRDINSIWPNITKLSLVETKMCPSNVRKLKDQLRGKNVELKIIYVVC